MKGLIDLSSELLIQRHANGVKLARPDSVAHHYTMGCSLASANLLPLNIYSYDLGNNIQFSNIENNRHCGFTSSEDLRSLHLTQVLDEYSADSLISNHQRIIDSNAMKFLDEKAVQKNGEYQWKAMTLKLPWYNEENVIIGIFGFSLSINNENQTSLSQYLMLLMNMGLLSPPIKNTPSISNFSKRENDVLFYVVRGKSAKEISLALGISYRTVETHIENAKNKIGANSKSELIEAIFHYF